MYIKYCLWNQVHRNSQLPRQLITSWYVYHIVFVFSLNIWWIILRLSFLYNEENMLINKGHFCVIHEQLPHKKPLKPRLKVSELNLSSCEDKALLLWRGAVLSSSASAASSFLHNWYQSNLKEKGCEFVKREMEGECFCLSLRYFIWFILKGYSIHINLSHFGHCSFYHLEFLCILLLLWGLNSLKMLMNSRALLRLVSIILREFTTS